MYFQCIFIQTELTGGIMYASVYLYNLIVLFIIYICVFVCKLCRVLHYDLMHTISRLMTLTMTWPWHHKVFFPFLSINLPILWAFCCNPILAQSNHFMQAHDAISYIFWIYLEVTAKQIEGPQTLAVYQLDNRIINIDK